MKIAFHDNILSLRGTTIAIYDWAYWTRYYLGTDPIIMFNVNYPQNNKDVYKKFESQFSVFGYSDKCEIDKILEQNKCDYFFMMKGGNKDGISVMPCTLHEDIVPKVAEPVHESNTDNPVDFPKPKKEKRHDPETMSVWCTDKQSWRSFKTMRVISVKAKND